MAGATGEVAVVDEIVGDCTGAGVAFGEDELTVGIERSIPDEADDPSPAWSSQMFLPALLMN